MENGCGPLNRGAWSAELGARSLERGAWSIRPLELSADTPHPMAPCSAFRASTIRLHPPSPSRSMFSSVPPALDRSSRGQPSTFRALRSRPSAPPRSGSILRAPPVLCSLLSLRPSTALQGVSPPRATLYAPGPPRPPRFGVADGTNTLFRYLQAELPHAMLDLN